MKESEEGGGGRREEERREGEGIRRRGRGEGGGGKRREGEGIRRRGRREEGGGSERREVKMAKLYTMEVDNQPRVPGNLASCISISPHALVNSSLQNGANPY